MTKRILAILLCLACLLCCFVGCSHGEDDKGPFIRMYVSEPVYDIDPLNAFDNKETLQIVGLLFEGLFVADDNGQPEKALTDDYEYIVDKEKGTYTLSVTLNDTKWSDGVPVAATDVQFAFRRLFASATSHPAVSLLYDIKNARAICAGNDTIDHLGVSVVDQKTIEIEFEKDIEVDNFLLALCSPALFPVRADVVEGNPNWGKSADTIVCNGPFTVRTTNFAEKDGFVLERNGYYYRNREKNDAIDKYVTPYRIIIDYTTPVDKQLENFNGEDENAVFYFGHIPLSLRGEGSSIADILKKADVEDTASTHVYYLNEKAIIGGEALFAKAEVRKALSLAIDRDALAAAIVYAEAADGLVPHKVLNREDKKTEFRKKAESYLASSANLDEAKNLLSAAGVKASDFSFAITVYEKNEDHLAIANLVKAAWEGLGFEVSLNKLGVEEIVDRTNPEKPEYTGAYNNLYREALDSGSFEVIALDLVANSSAAFGYLAPFAKAFSGNAINMDATVNPNYELTPHITGYDSEEYNQKIEAAFAAEKEKDRAALLHEAEAILMRDLPVIPMVYNKSVSLVGKDLSKVKTNFFTNAVFTKTKLSGYWDFALLNGFVEEEDE
ncbi:MAG: hypothetical protein E7663_01370 [Ruminococcaceae bacterium]|nr:hypothetical protein [Oscillospiraceae bacterium]